MATANEQEQFEEILKEVNSETGDESSNTQVEETKKEEVKSSEMVYPHEKIMKEEGITKNDLPEEIKKMVNTFERSRRMATMKNAKEATFLKIQNLSTLIADKIIDYIESDIPQKEDGGGIEGMTDMGMDDSSATDDLDDGVDDLEDGEVESKEKGGLFNGILGGILDW
jgi:hypothetical protein